MSPARPEVFTELNQQVVNEVMNWLMHQCSWLAEFNLAFLLRMIFTVYFLQWSLNLYHLA